MEKHAVPETTGIKIIVIITAEVTNTFDNIVLDNSEAFSSV